MIGLAITAVYKYADAVTKCIASDITAVLLCIVSSFFFELTPSVTMWCGVVVVCFAVHLYTSAVPPPKPEEKPSPEKATEVATKEASGADASLRPNRLGREAATEEDTELSARLAEQTG